ncbi:hypothetical protein [Egicoccus sp. AB-alg2]|uniref:hypothetical protein n=1 Tax=Egicoccus sp. AB-alg2 TaxID=3242693 RepID=UPI00359CBF76
MPGTGDDEAPVTLHGARRRRRRWSFVAVPVTLGLFFWFLAWAIERAREYGLL